MPDFTCTLSATFEAATEDEARETFLIWINDSGYIFDDIEVTRDLPA
jgi:hypothetical protein